MQFGHAQTFCTNLIILFDSHCVVGVIMKKIYDNILEMTGSTPMVRLNKLGNDVSAEILVKVESANPTCSIKDRIALYMIEEAERQGLSDLVLNVDL